MKKLSYIALVVAVAGCASKAPPAPPAAVSPVGQSTMVPKAAAMCIGQKWATAAGQTAYIQYVYANDTAFDVYVPGQLPPDGSAVLVRQGGAGSMVSFRGVAPAMSGPAGQCQ
jgi:hypothetical protein